MICENCGATLHVKFSKPTGPQIRFRMRYCSFCHNHVPTIELPTAMLTKWTRDELLDAATSAQNEYTKIAHYFANRKPA